MVVCVFWGQTSVNSQSLEVLSKLPNACPESSGLVFINNNSFITHNDGGDGPNLYFIDSSGIVQRKVNVKNAINTDWEDITMAPDGRVFIGNFGNNGNNRKDLEILVLPDYKKWKSDTVEPDKIFFSYDDQNAFPPSSDNRVFDCEALAFYKDSLYIFSKNWSSPFSGMVKMYVLPAAPGTYAIQPRDSVNLGTVKEIAWVTGADIQDSSLYLVGSAFVWRFNFLELPNLTSPTQLALNHFSQKEAIAVNGNNIYITDEASGGFGQLYRFTQKNPNATAFEVEALRIKVNQTTNSVWIQNKQRESLHVELIDISGKMVSVFVGNDAHIDLDKNIIEKCILRPGVYMLHISAEKNINIWTKVFISQ
ncbi:MAG: hypothetical protein ACI9UJ_000671 [bacterium]